MPRILIVDDERIISSSLQRVLSRAGHDTLLANNGIEAIQTAERERARPFDLVFLDLLMPEVGGGEVLDFLRRAMPGTKVLMMTAYGDPSAKEDLMRRGAHRVLSKPFDDIMAIPRLVEEVLSPIKK